MRHRAQGPIRRILIALVHRVRRPFALPLAGHPDRTLIYVLSTALVLLLGTAGWQQLSAENDVGRLTSVQQPLSSDRSEPGVSRSAGRPETPSAAFPSPNRARATADASGATTPAEPTSSSSPDLSATGEGRTPAATSRLASPRKASGEDGSPTQPTGGAGSPDGADSPDADSPDEADSPSPSEETEDTDPPQTTIVSGPTNNSESRFEFDADEAATFSCSLDGGAYQPCDSDEEFEDLEPGRHTLAVRATDLDGNTDPSPAQWEWHTNGR